MNKLATVIACTLATGTLIVNAAPAPLGSGIDTQYIDAKVRIQDDYYQHVNGGWLSTVEIPADKSRYGSFDKLNDDTQDQLHSLVENLVRNRMARTPDQQKIVDLYSSFMDEAAIEHVGTEPLQRAFTRISGFTDKTQLASLVAHYNRVGVQTLISTVVHQDAKDSTQYVFDIGQSGLGLPDRDYYLQDDARFKSIREQYTQHISRMFMLAGVANTSEQAALVANFETELARIQWSRVENRDPVKTYNKVALSQLGTLAPGFNWTAYLADAGVSGRANGVIISQPSYITELDKLLQQTPLATLQAYFRWHLISSFAPYMGKAFVDERFAFAGKTLRGIEVNRPRWKRAITLVDGSIGEGLGQLYVAQYFPPESKQRMDQLVRNLIAAYKTSIDKLDWMGPETRKRAQAKLAKFSVKIGYPNKWIDYSGLQIVAGDVVGNVLRSNEFEYNRKLNRLGKPIDREEWEMSPQTINAYYNPEQNVIVFPAAILQPPFFNPKADDAVNYGGIGGVIGHEISHGFDDQGSQYDGDGNLMGVPGWFTQADLDKFKARTQALVGQYNAIEPISGLHINGELTLGENIADNSGIAIAYKAYQISLAGKKAPVIDGMTGPQRFYFGWAQVWRSKFRENELVVRIKSDPHSPDPTRGTLPPTNQASFFEAFGIKPGDKMYRAPADRVTIW